MKIERTRSFSDEYVLNEQLLREICETLINQMGLIINLSDIVTNFKLKLQDLKYGNDGESEHSSLTTMLAEDNGDAWIIRELEIKIYDRNNPDLHQISLEFNKQEQSTLFSIALLSKSSSMISSVISTGAEQLANHLPLLHKSMKYTIIGNDRDWVYFTSLKLEEKLAKVRQFAFATAGLGLFPICILGAIILIGYSSNPSENFKPPLGIEILAGFILLLLTILGLTFTLYFPPHNFCWGEYKKTFEAKHALGKTIINIVIVGLLIGVVGSIVGTLIFLK